MPVVAPEYFVPFVMLFHVAPLSLLPCHWYDGVVPVAAAVMTVFDPRQMGDVAGCALTTTGLFTITLCDPERSELSEVQIPLVSEARLYVVVTVGLTVILIEGALPENDVPFVSVPEIFPDPLTAILNVAEPPWQITVESTNRAVGLGFIVIEKG